VFVRWRINKIAFLDAIQAKQACQKLSPHYRDGKFIKSKHKRRAPFRCSRESLLAWKVLSQQLFSYFPRGIKIRYMVIISMIKRTYSLSPAAATLVLGV